MKQQKSNEPQELDLVNDFDKVKKLVIGNTIKTLEFDTDFQILDMCFHNETHLLLPVDVIAFATEKKLQH